ncbi:hypothetical protein [Aequorivita flava]|uniref:SGNH/GDSL hydrolase family protein n=1 Tax=Aequorivita flava TaxID=3114371 RepID=A0AB35YSW3_9FLAO
MKRFLLSTIFLIIALIATMYVCDSIYTYAFQNAPPRNKIQKILKLNNKEYDYVFLGSSRTENHIDCALIEKITGKTCINLGISGGTIGDMLFILKIAERNNVRFRQVFLQIDYNYNHNGISRNVYAELMPFIHDSLIRNEIENYKNYSWMINFPFYRYMKNEKVVGFREFFTALLNKKPNKDIDIGFMPFFGIGYDLAGKFPENFNKSNIEIDEMLELSKRDDFELKFFTAPYCKEVENRENAQSLIKRIPSLHNYISLFDENPQYFSDCGHLNIEGAEAFTKKICNDLIIKHQ